eukprot:364747-Chlamydomonas_euryale.AAC.20
MSSAMVGDAICVELCGHAAWRSVEGPRGVPGAGGTPAKHAGCVVFSVELVCLHADTPNLGPFSIYLGLELDVKVG